MNNKKKIVVLLVGLVAGAWLAVSPVHRADAMPKSPVSPYGNCVNGCGGAYGNDMTYCAGGSYNVGWYAGCVAWAQNKVNSCISGCNSLLY